MTASIAVTRLLDRWQHGDNTALDELVAIVYDELKRLATAQLRREVAPSIQPTELVAEAYVRLLDVDAIDWQSRSHFFSVAARTMRRVLVDRYRRRNAERRGGGQTFVTLSDDIREDRSTSVDLARLDDALTELEQLDPRQAEIVTMRFFGGLKGEEIAHVLSVSPRTVKREWAAARLWLFRSLAIH